MTKENQKRLYSHFVNLSKIDNGIKGKNAALRAAQILKSFPEFEKAKPEGK